ncbi:BRCA1-A complex subunit RAP80 [Bombina bombina]|uniref:BRCA1-A complex subunit RAP80 n=1 Tax=Bombina bombina TaxID=8345 RepID=UPI00235B1261|nr:BRCA1-A complex subunit RAP80 [Bombina bombina]
MHAAYCDGTCKDDTEKITVLRSRKRIVGKNLASPDDILPTPDSGKCEKCYLCKSRVPIGDYKRHVDSCIQNATQETQNNRKLRTTKESAVKDGRLLRMLEQSESESSEANTIAPIPDYISASPPKEDSGVNPEDLSLVDSPIRSFVSISEAKDCLVDFKQQFSRRPGSSGLSNRVRGRRRRR